LLSVSLLASAALTSLVGGREFAQEPVQRVTLKGHAEPVLSVTFSPDGKTLASGGADRCIKLWDVATGNNTVTLTGEGDRSMSVAFSPDGKTLASGSSSGTANLVNLASGKAAVRLPGHTSSVWSVAFSPDSRTLATGSWDKSIRLWDVATGKNTATLTGHTDRIFGVAFNPDGKLLASASDDRTVRLWDVATGKSTATLVGHTHYVISLAFSPDGKTLASLSRDGTVKLWEVITAKERFSLRGHTNTLGCVAFSPDGKTLALSGSEDKTIDLLDAATRKKVATLKGHTGPVWSVTFSPDGKTLASGGDDTTIKLWDVPSAEVSVKELSREEAEKLWDDLAADAPRAYRAVWVLALAPKGSLPLLRERLKPAVAPKAEDVARLIADLDSDDFQARRRAGAELSRVAALIAPELRQALKDVQSREVRRSLQELVESTEGPITDGERLRMLRAVEALGLIGTEEARAVLRELAKGPPAAPETQAAKQALDRLTKRTAVSP
jgi:Tol biopolymer transport system component